MGIVPWFCISGLWALRRQKVLLPISGIVILSIWVFVPNLFIPVLPDFRTIYSYLPGLNMFHNIERFMFLGVFGMSILLSMSIDSWSERPNRYSMIIPLLLFVTLGLLSVASYLFQHNSELLPFYLNHKFNRLSAISGGNYITYTKAGSAMFIFLILSFGITAARAWFHLSRQKFLWLVLIVLSIDLMVFGYQFKPTLDINSLLSNPPKLAHAIPKGKRLISVVSRPSWPWDRDLSPFEARRTLGANFNLFYGISEVGGYMVPIMTDDDYYILNTMLAEVTIQKNFVKRDVSNPLRFSIASKLWRFYSIEYVITDYEFISPGVSLIERDGNLRLYKINNSLPRVFCSSYVHVVNDMGTLVTRMIKNPLSSAIVFVTGQGFKQDIMLGKGNVSTISEDSTSLTVEVQAEKKGTFLVITDRWSKEWWASIDGQPVKLYKVNGIQRGVMVPEGNHTVHIKYFDKHLTTGLFISGFILLVLAGISLWLFIRWIKEANENS
jgi:hypothetical protein